MDLIFKHTSTLGTRETIHDRYYLERKIETINTDFGRVRLKKSSGYDTNRTKYEYEDIAKIAIDNNMSLQEIKEKLKK